MQGGLKCMTPIVGPAQEGRVCKQREVPVSSFFADDYVSARQRFLAAARAAGARIRTFPLEAHRTPSDEELAIDVAWLGDARAERVLLVTSGMHGFEGPAGSAVQSSWLEGAGRAVFSGLAVCLVHALNPWGFAWISRLTENNVDLNRNFIDWYAPVPANAFYAHVRDLIRVPDVSPDTLMRMGLQHRELAARLGPAAMQVAVDFGQYDDPEGITFGGSGREFGHRVLEDHIVPMLAPARQLGVIDLHTGVGAFGELAILPIDGAGSANASVIEGWWGRDAVRNWKRSELEAVIEQDPKLRDMPLLKTGQMKQALQRWLPHARINGAVVEFGTERPGALPSLILVTLYERWLRFVDRSSRMAPQHALFRQTARECFCPEDAGWRRFVVDQGPPLIDRAIQGLNTPFPHGH